MAMSHQQLLSGFLSFPDAQSQIVLRTDFKIEKQLGSGGWATVYQVTSHKKTLALKVMKVDPFNPGCHEAAQLYAMRPLNIPNIIHYYGHYVGEYKNRSYVPSPATYHMVGLELIQGGTVEDWIKNPKPTCFVTPAEQRVGAYQIACALKVMHQYDFLHNDIKSANIMIQFVETGRAILKLVDFGLSLSVHESGNTYQLGTPIYMAYEVVNELYRKTEEGKNTTKSDVCSFMYFLYEFMTKTSMEAYWNKQFANQGYDRWDVACHVFSGKRPELPKDETIFPKGIASMIGRGWLSDRNQRPSMPDVADCIGEEIIHDMEQGRSTLKS